MMLKGKNAVITGARRGIGRAIVEVFAKNGANMWVCCRKKDDLFEEDMSDTADRYGVQIRPVYFDLTDETQTKKAVQDILRDKVPIDILVNNAGQASYSKFTMMPIDELKKMLDCNYISTLRLTQLIVRRMIRNNKGTVLFLSSMAGLEAESGNTAYGGSKAAISHAVGILSKELAPYNIRVNAVAPGLVNTDMKNQADENSWKELIEKVYLKRMADPKEIANVICFLVSDLASYVTGQVLRVDGGL